MKDFSFHSKVFSEHLNTKKHPVNLPYKLKIYYLKMKRAKKFESYVSQTYQALYRVVNELEFTIDKDHGLSEN